MSIPGLTRLRGAAQWLRNKFVGKGLILLYHRVAELPSDPYRLCVTPQYFAEHLEVLKKSYQPMPLQQLVQALRDGGFPDQAVAVTFDDGYIDNLYQAKPLLGRSAIPATVFVTTGFIRQEGECWWDELDRLLLQPGTLPATLRLNVSGNAYQWELSEAVHYGEEDLRRYRRWSVLEKDDPSRRHFLYRSLYQLLRPLSKKERRRVLDELLAWAHAESLARPTHRVLSPDEVLHLAEGGLVEVGAHSETHPVLSKLSVADQRVEIEGSKARLEEILGRPVTSFAYPYGGRSQFTAETVAIVREAGFSLACSTLAEVVWRGTNCFRLPRVAVQDWNGEEFARRLRRWLGG